MMNRIGQKDGLKMKDLTCTLLYVKWVTSASLMLEAGHAELVLWDNPEGSGGEGGGSMVQDGWTHVYLWPILADVWPKPSQSFKVIILQLK